MLAADLFVGEADDFLVTIDTGAAGLSAGDTVTWQSGSAAEITGLIYGTTAFGTISSAVTAATAGDTINVAPGTFSELVTIGKSLTLLGAQAGVKATGAARTGGETIIDGTGGSSSFNITVEADNVTIDGFKVEIRNSARDGINTRTNAAVTKPGDASLAYRANVTLRNNWIYANLPARTNQINGIVFGESTDNAPKSVSAEIANVTIRDNYIDLTTTSSNATPSSTSITGARGIVFTNMFRNGGASLAYTGLVVDDNTVFSTYQTILQAQLQTRLVGATFTDNTIGNSRSGPSLPTLVGGSVFSRNTIQNINPGSDYYSNLAGAYLGVVDSTVADNTFSNIGGTAGLVLAGGRSADATYFPASSNSTVSNNSFTYNDQAVSSLAGYTSGVLFETNTVSAGVNVGGWLTGRQAGTAGAQAGSITLSGNTFVNSGFSGSLPAVAVSQESVGTTVNAVNATANTFNGISLSGSTTTADLFSVADQVADVIDATTLGGVTLKSGNVYVTPNSFWSAASTTQADVQRAVSVAAAGQTVFVKSGVYAAGTAAVVVDNLTVDVPSGVTGFTGLVLDAAVTNGTATLSGNGNANLTGNTGNNSLTGNAGNNSIDGGTGTDTVDGAAGIDTVVFSGVLADYLVEPGESDVVVIKESDNVNVTATNVEVLDFADGRVRLVGGGSSYTTIEQGIKAARAADADRIFIPAQDFPGFVLRKQLVDGRPQLVDVADPTIEYSTNNGISWSTSFTAEEGSNSILVRQNLGASSVSEPNAFSFEFDSISPTVAISMNRADVAFGQTAVVTFTVDDDIYGFAVDDVTVTGGELSGISGTWPEFTATFTPTVSFTGQATISIDADQFEDDFSNGNTAANSVEFFVDAARPIVSVTADTGTLKGGQTTTITFSLNEPSVNFTVGDVRVSGGELSGFAGSGTEYTATFTPFDDFNGTGQITVLAESFSDAIGNTNGTTYSLDEPLVIRTTGPRATVQSVRESLTLGIPTSTITIVLNRAVTGIDATSLRSLLAVTGGALSALAGSGTNFTGTFTATPGYEGEGTVTIAAGAIVDEAGNESLAAQVAIMIDLAPATLEITTDKYALGAGETAAITFTASEPVSGFIATDVVVTGGKLIGFVQSSPTVYSGTFVPFANKVGTGTMSVAMNRFVDAAGNPNSVGELSPPITYNTIVPTVSIAQRLAVVPGGQGTLLTFTINGDPRSTANPFEAADISVPVGQGTISNFAFKSFSSGKAIYTASYTAPAGLEATVPVTVPANAFLVAGNAVNANQQTSLGIKVDGVAPTVLSVISDRNTLNASQTAKLTFTLSESSRTFTAADVTVTGGSLSAFAASDTSGRVYTATLTPAAIEGQATVRVLGNVFTDLAGNNNTASSVLGITVDAVAPAQLTNVALKTDTGFSATDKKTSDPTLVVTGQEPGATLQYSLDGTVWNLSFAPAQGANTVQVRQVDAAGNPSVARSLGFTYLSTSPTIAALVLPAASVGLTAGKFIDFQVTFSRTVRVTGSPFIEIGGFTTGGATRKAAYLSGTGTTKLTFRYVVQAGDKALSGITIPLATIQHQLASVIVDEAGNAATISFSLPSRRPITKVNA